MQGVADAWSGNLSIGGKEWSMDPSSMPSLMIFNHVHQHLPSIKLTVHDTNAYILEKLGINDGSPIEVEVGDGRGGKTGTMKFKVVGQPDSKPASGGELVTLSGVLDNVAWLRKIAQGSFKGTSGNAIQQLAAQAGLTAIIDPSADAMTWLANNKPLAAMARHVASRAWASGTSGFVMGVRDTAQLIFRDVDKAIASSSGIRFTNTDANGCLVLEAQQLNKGKVLNNYAGYGATSIELNPEGIFNELNQISANLINNALSIGQEIVSAIGEVGGRVFPQVLNADNVHKKFYDAVHQNVRVLSTYSNDVQVLVDTVSQAGLLDAVDTSIMSNSYNQLTRLSGRFIVSSINRVIASNRYSEKLTLTSQG